jgi:glucan 1,3-beta-glucosidase
MPSDPRQAIGTCGNSNPWNPPLKSWQVGGAGAGNIPASAASAVAWPPQALATGGPVSAMPSYTPTGALPTLPVPTFTAPSSSATVNAGSGWNNPSDTTGLSVNIAGCSYPDPWVDPNSAVPPSCGAAARRSEITSSPSPSF